LSEPRLAEKFKISRSPVREALTRLESEGFLDRSENGRLRAAALNVEELEQLYVLRAAIEGLAARLATFHLSTAHLEMMEKTIEEMETHSQSGDVDLSLEAGAQFHALIYKSCANNPLLEAIETVKLRIVRYRAIIASTRLYDVRVSEHKAIHQAFLDRDPIAAEKSLIAHVESSARAIIGEFRNIELE
tara:strand:- start:2408 stop:2974 length:567 start_codon:yes stop_codon:yes gene_type:complete